MAVAALTAGLTLTACGGGDSTDAAGTGGGAKGDASCAAYTQYGSLKGENISMYSAHAGEFEDNPTIASYKTFERCTGATITYAGDASFPTEIMVRTKAGNPPDLAMVLSPTLLRELIKTKAVKAPPAEVAALTDKFYSPQWKKYATVDGTFYGAPIDAAVKSLVWYSPKQFTEHGWKVPTTLGELNTLSDTISAAGVHPWCVGIASGEGTGWPMTDWMEDWMLRMYGTEVYDKWVDHKIAFNGPEATGALNAVGAIVRNPKFVNGGLGDVKSIASTSMADGGLPILDGACALHRQANFYAGVWPKGTKIGPDGDIFAFYLPGKDASSKPVLGAGDFVVAFNERPAVKAFQTYLATDTYANERIKAAGEMGGFITPNKGADITLIQNPIDKLSTEILLDPKTEFRFDGSDLMPANIAGNVFNKEITDWATGQSTQATLQKIEAAWPKN